MVETKYFGGKRYKMATSSVTRGVAMELTKKEAIQIAVSKRAHGYYARITREASGWVVWIRKKNGAGRKRRKKK